MENALSVEISFNNETSVAEIMLTDWAPALVDYLRRYFTICEDRLRLDYSHLPPDNISPESYWQRNVLAERDRFVFVLNAAAQQGPVALTLTILGHRSSDIQDSSSILNRDTYCSAVEDFRKEVLHGESRALRKFIVAKIAPREVWVSWLLGDSSYSRNRFLEDREVMAALVSSTSDDDCMHTLELVDPGDGQNNWAFEQLVVQHWQHVRDYLDEHVSKTAEYSARQMPDLVFSLFANSPSVQASRWACEQVVGRAHPTAFPRLIQHCRTIQADDVRSLFQRWHIRPKTDKKDGLKKCFAEACSNLAAMMQDTMPADLAFAAAFHDFGEPVQSGQQSVLASLRELPSDAWDREAAWNQLGPSAREAWRQDLFDQVRVELDLAQGLLDFACRWLEQTAFAEVEPVLLRLIDDEDYLAFVNQLASAASRQVQLRAKGLIRSIQGALDLEGPIGEGDKSTMLPSVGARTWLVDPSVERVIHSSLSQIEEKFCHEYSTSWGEDEEVHTARLLALTQEAVGNASRHLGQLSVMTRGVYPSLSVKVRQPSKREEGATTSAGAPLGADVLFLTRIVDQGKTVIERATLVQVKKRSGTESGKSFSTTLGINLQQCEDMLTQTEHAYYLFTTPVSTRSMLWVAPARLVRNLVQLNTSKASVPVAQVRDASCSYADFFLHYLVGLWAGDEDEDIVAIANGDPRRGRTPRHIVDIEIRRQSD
jgi:hypothetical protein